MENIVEIIENAEPYAPESSTKKADNSNNATNGSLGLEAPEIYPHPVNGAKLVEEIISEINRFLILEEGSVELLAFWIIYTYGMDIWDYAPRLVIKSPEKRCGKTTLMKVLNRLTYKPLSVSNISAASIYRVTEIETPTLLLDEADTFLKESEDMRGIINSGHSRDMAYVLRTDGRNYEVKRFSTWLAIAIAGIGNVPDTIEDRSIIIHMKRKAPSEKVERFRKHQTKNLDSLSSKIYRWVNDNRERLDSLDVDLPEELPDRLVDNFSPLLTIAEIIGNGWRGKLLEIAYYLNKNKDNSDDSTRVLLLSDLQNLFKSHGSRLSSQIICDLLIKEDSRPWCEFNRGRSITPTNIARLLKPFGIQSKNLRINNTVVKGYEYDDFKDTFIRYLNSKNATELQSSNSNGCNNNTLATLETTVAGENLLKPTKTNTCSDVASN